MKRVHILLVALLAFMTASALPVDSLTRDTVNGKVVYKYTVQKSEGLYRISKNFGVSQEEIINLNPILKSEGLKLGQIIYIPAVEQFDSTQYVVHTLQPKETLYGLSRKYGVSQKDIERLNPQTAKRMAIGTTLLIKKRDVSVAADETRQAAVAAIQAENKPLLADKEPIHPVSPQTTDKPLSEEPQYNTSLHADNTPVESQTETLPLSAETDNNTQYPIDTEETSPTILPATISELPLRLAFMLPFMTDATKRDANINRFIDFYEGALIAIYEAQQLGQQFEIYTYDVEKSDLAVQQVLGKGELQMMDAIIGPAYPAQVSYATLFAKQNKIPLLIPFTQKVNGIEHTPSVMQFNPTPEMNAEALVDSLEKEKERIRFILVDAGEKDIPQSVKAVHKVLSDTVFEIVYTSVKEILNDSLNLVLSKERENIVVFNSEKFSSIQVLIPKLQQLTPTYSITLYGHYSWQTENIGLPMIYTGVFHSYDSSRIGHFETLYHHFFGHALASEHPRFDLLGYDLTRALIIHLQQCTQQPNEQLTDECISQPVSGIQSDILFRRIGEQGGRINAAIKVIRTN